MSPLVSFSSSSLVSILVSLHSTEKVLFDSRAAFRLGNCPDALSRTRVPVVRGHALEAAWRVPDVTAYQVGR